jgi:integrase
MVTHYAQCAPRRWVWLGLAFVTFLGAGLGGGVIAGSVGADRLDDAARAGLLRPDLDRERWKRVLAVARARLTPTAQERCSRQVAARDLALIQTLGCAGLRSQEARTLPTDPFDQGRSDNRGGGVYLRVQGKGRKVRAVPLFTDVVDALELRREQRDRIPELADDPSLFPRLVPQRRRPAVNDGCD